MKCTNCGSYAINPHLHGRDQTRLDLCDVCFWRNKAEGLNLTKPNVGDIVFALDPHTGEQFKATVVSYEECDNESVRIRKWRTKEEWIVHWRKLELSEKV